MAEFRNMNADEKAFFVFDNVVPTVCRMSLMTDNTFSCAAYRIWARHEDFEWYVVDNENGSMSLYCMPVDGIVIVPNTVYGTYSLSFRGCMKLRSDLMRLCRTRNIGVVWHTLVFRSTER